MTLEMIEKVVSNVTGTPIAMMHKNTRKREVVWPRQITMYFASELTKLTWDKIGAHFGKDHATALYARKRINDLLFSDKQTKECISLCRQDMTKHNLLDWYIIIKRELEKDEIYEMCNIMPQY